MARLRQGSERSRRAGRSSAVLETLAKGDFVRVIGSYTTTDGWVAGAEESLAGISAADNVETMWPYLRFKTFLKTSASVPIIWAVVLKRSGDAVPALDDVDVMETYRREGRLFHWEFAVINEANRFKMLDIKFRNIKPAQNDWIGLVVCPLVTANYDWQSVIDYSKLEI